MRANLVRNWIEKEEGTAVVLVALALTALLGFTGMVVDVGQIYLERTRLSNVLDAAALAGTQELPVSPSEAEYVALDYVERNGLDPEQVEVTVANDQRGLTLTSQESVPLRFAPFVGVGEAAVEAQATARVAPISAVQGAAPLCVVQRDYEYGQLYQLKEGAGPNEPEFAGDPIGKGWFGPLALGGTGAQDYRDNLQYGYNGALRVGDIADVQTGNISDPTRKAIEWRFGQEAGSLDTWQAPRRENKRILIIPVVNPTSYDGNHVSKVQILGFAAFWVEEIPRNGAYSEIYGRFLRLINNGDSDDGAVDSGLYGVRLVQ